MGRTLASSVLADDDSIIAEADTVVTEDVFDRLLAAKVLETVCILLMKKMAKTPRPLPSMSAKIRSRRLSVNT